MRKSMLLLAAALAAPALSAQTRSFAFSDASGLAAEADVTLQAGGTQLEIRLRNRATAFPLGFSNSDQILTGLSFDLGDPGVNASDPAIVSGTARTGPASASVNFDVTNVGPDADVSGEWGYSNTPTTMTYPNFVSANQSMSIPFGGPNLDGPVNLAGPQGGLVSVDGLALGGLGAIEDEIVAVVDLSVAIPDLAFLDNGVRVEYGSDAAFLDACDDEAENVVLSDPLGYDLEGGLMPFPGDLPTIGSTNFRVQVDDSGDACGITPGAWTYVIVNESPLVETLIPNAGCAPGAPGNLMIDVTDPMTHCSGPIPWAGPGSPAVHSFRIADAPSLCGIVCRGQGVFLDPGGSSGPIVLTNVVEFHIGP